MLDVMCEIDNDHPCLEEAPEKDITHDQFKYMREYMICYMMEYHVKHNGKVIPMSSFPHVNSKKLTSMFKDYTNFNESVLYGEIESFSTEQ
jgi:hypothetical protein